MPVCARMLTCTFGGKRTAFQSQFFPSTVGSGDQTLFFNLPSHLAVHPPLFWDRVSWDLELAHLPRLTGQGAHGSACLYPSSTWVTDSNCCGCLGIKLRVSRLRDNHLSECDISPVPLPLPFSVLTIEPRASHQGKIALWPWTTTALAFPQAVSWLGSKLEKQIILWNVCSLPKKWVCEKWYPVRILRVECLFCCFC